MVGRSRQKGMSLLHVTLGLIVAAIAAVGFANKEKRKIEDILFDTEAKRYAEITQAVIRYQSSGGDPATGLLSPIQQAAVAGQPFFNGRTHVGLNWLKSTGCPSGLGTAPFDVLPCDYDDLPLVGDISHYRFTITNDGTDISTNLSIRNTNNPAQGIVINNNLDEQVAALISAKAEPMVTFSMLGGVNTLFDVDRPIAMPFVNIAMNVANLPYLTRTGDVTVTGDLHWENNASIIFDTAGDIVGAENISAERFAAYDRGTNTVSTNRYLEPDGTSIIENIELQRADAARVDTTELTATRSQIDNLEVEYIQQIDASLQNRFAGEVRIGDNTNNTTIGQGHILTTGNIYDANDPNFLIDLNGTSRMQDIAVGNLNDALLSDRLANFVLKGVVAVRANDLVPQPPCGTVGSARLILTPQTWTTYFLENGSIYINNNVSYLSASVSGSSNWRVNFKTHRVSDQQVIDDPNGRALAQVYCYYPS